jgi:hypothetical protein
MMSVKSVIFHLDYNAYLIFARQPFDPLSSSIVLVVVFIIKMENHGLHGHHVQPV